MSAGGIEDRVRDAVRRGLGREVASVEEIAAGLGRRRFFRVRLAGGEPSRLVARVESPEDPARRPAGVPPEPPLEPLRSFLEQSGIPVPARYGGDDDIALLEDLGTLALRDVALAAPAAERRRLYEEACDLVARLQRLHESPARIAAFGRRLDSALFRYKADFFARWSLPQALGRAATDAEVAVVHAAFGFVAAEAAAAPQRLAHRDLQGANVLVRAGAPPGARLALIDLQGAFLAPPEYDLVCLLRDSYVELDDAEVSHQLSRIRGQLPGAPDASDFARRFDLLTLTRKGKDHALGFYHAALRADPREVRFAPVCARYLRAAARRTASLDPRLARLAELIEGLPAVASAAGAGATAGRRPEQART